MRHLLAVTIVAVVAVVGLAGQASAQNAACNLDGLYYFSIAATEPESHAIGSFQFTRPGVPGTPPCQQPTAVGVVRVRIGDLDVQVPFQGFVGPQFIVTIPGAVMVGFAAHVEDGLARGFVFSGGGGDTSFSGTALRSQ